MKANDYVQRFAPDVSLFLHVDIMKMSESDACDWIGRLLALSDRGMLRDKIKYENTGL